MHKRIILLIFSLTSVVGICQAQDFDDYLKGYEAELHLRLNHYDRERYNYLLDRKRVSLNEDLNEIDFKDSKWSIKSSITETGQRGQFNIEIQFECTEGGVNDASVSVDLSFRNWSDSNYVLMPAAVYNGNRYPAIRMSYMPFFNDPKQIGLDNPIILSDQPRLNWRNNYSRIQERSGSMSFPSVAFKEHHTDQGFFMFFDQGNDYGDYGIDVEEKAGKEKAVVTLTSPLVREQRMYAHTRMDASPPYEQPAQFKKGDIVKMEFRVDFFKAPKVQSLFDKMVQIRESYYSKSELKRMMPFSKAYQIQEQKWNKDNWKEEGYFATGTYDDYFQDWQIGWTGGMMTTLPLLMSGSETTRARVLKNFDWLAKNGLSPSGYYFGTIYKGDSQGDFPNKSMGKDLVLTRKNADATYYIFKQFDLMKKLGIEVKPTWETTNFKALNAQLNTFKEYGQLGHFANQVTGELVIGNTTSAGIFPAALTAAYHYSGDETYLDYARQIGAYYYEDFIIKGLSCGGPGDAMQSFDSESSYGLLVSMIELYEATRDELWLTRSKEMANQFASWVVAYDYAFPETTTFNKMAIQSTGAVYANTQNKHGAPGICTHSGIALFKLYRATQNPFYLNLLEQITQTLPQFMTWGEHRFPECKDGWMSERCNITDYHPALGETFPYSGWSETAFLLSITELPGVYIDLDKNEVFSFDHIDAEIIASSPGQTKVKISNRTPYDGTLKVFAERTADMKSPLFHNASMNWEKIEVKSGASTTLTFKK